MKMVAVAALCVLCAAQSACLGMPTLKDPSCTTKISAEGAFGSVTPTGKWKLSATCRPSDTAPLASAVVAPDAPAEVPKP
jgi:hypothetical protein